MFNNFTSNYSFLRVAYELEKEGIKNYNWMLCLNNESLITVDPYDDLEMPTKLDVIKECFENPMYFFRELVRIPTIQGKPKMLGLNKGTAAKIYCWLNGISNITMICRQSYKSHTSAAILVYEFLFNKDQRLNIQSKYNKNTMSMVCEILSLLPNYLLFYKEYVKPFYIYSVLNNKIANNTIRIGYNIKNSEESFSKAATGLSCDYLLIDDLAHHKYFNYYYQNIVPSVAKNDTIVDINTIYDRESEFLKYQWFRTRHWTNQYYDSTILIGCDKIFIHFEPEEILTEKQIEENKMILLQDPAIIIREMCIHPFE